MILALAAWGLLSAFSSSVAAVPRVAAGYHHSLLLEDDGTVWAWGRNTNGQLGDGTFTDRHFPVQVKGPGGTGYLTGVVAIAAGSHHSLALRSDGTVWAWGGNWAGQLGDGTTTGRSIPVQVKGPGGTGYLTGVVAVAAGDVFSLALRSDGTVWAWGGNAYGQLGDGTTSRRLTPVQVKDPSGTGYLSGVTAIAAGPGGAHALALGPGGIVWAWGRNDYRQLGDGTTQNRSVPGQVYDSSGTGYLSGIQHLAAGARHSLALAADGTVWAWGSNGGGRLGQGAYGSYSYPVRVKGPGGVLSGVTAVSAGSDFSLALRSDGWVWAWGSNYFSQIGNGAAWDVLSPQPVAGMGGVVAISGGGGHALAVKESGAVWAWGLNNYGQLGDGTQTQRSVPGQVRGPGGSGYLAGVSAVAGGLAFSLALRSDGTVWAWGHNDYGQLGDGTRANRNIPVQVPGLTDVTAVAAGADHSLALRSDGTVWAWGRNTSGQLGDGTTTGRSTPVQVKGPGGSGYLDGIIAVASRGYHSLALRSDSTVWAWGSNGCGQLGDGTTQNRTVPVQVYGPGGQGYLTDIVAIAAGLDHSLALRSDGTVWAWGCNSGGRLGDGSTENRTVPVQVYGPGGQGYLTDIVALAAGSSHSLALRSDGTVWAWGYNGNGQLGDGTTINRSTPVQVKGPGGAGYLTGVVAVAAGWYHSLAVSSDGTAWAWGENTYGTLGDGTGANRATPVQVAGPDGAGYLAGVAALAGGRFHTLALGNDGGVWSWGFNGFGQRGDGAPMQTATPVQTGWDVLPPALTAVAYPSPATAPQEVTVAVYADEPLTAPPSVSVTPAGGASQPVSMAPAGPNAWTGTYHVGTATPGGVADITAQAADPAGNAGGLSLTFRRASPAFADDRGVADVHTPRFAPGRFAQAVRVEEGAANLVRNGSLETGTTIYWYASNNSAAGDNGTVGLSSDAVVGRYSLEYTITNHPSWGYFGNAFYTYRMRPYFDPAKRYTLSFYAKGVAGSTTLWVRITDGNGTNIVMAPQSLTLSPSWQRYVFTFTPAQAGNSPVIHLQLPSGATGTVRVDGMQLEEGEKAAPIRPEASASSGEVLSFVGVALPREEGTVEAWVYLDESGVGRERYWFDAAGPANRNLQALVLTDGRPALRYGTSMATVEIAGSAALSLGTWHHLAFRWSPTGAALFVDGAAVVADPTPPDLVVADAVYFGSRADGTLQINGLLDDLRLSSRARSDAEIEVAYQRNAPLPWDAWTTYKADFDGSLAAQAGFYVNDVAPPAVTGLTPPDGGWSNTRRPAIGATVSDPSGIDADRLGMTVDGLAVTPTFDPATGSVRYIPATELAEGAHSVALTVYDTFGNAATAAWSFAVDTVAPVLTVTVEPTTVTPGQNVTITVYADETLSASPTVAFTPSGGETYAVGVYPAGLNTWVGTYTVPYGSHSGPVRLDAEGSDPAGNRGGPVAAFTRNSTAYGDDGAAVPAGAARFGPGRSGQALLVEEGTTNLLSAACSSFEPGGICWGKWGDVDLENASDWAWHGQRSLKITRTVTGGGGGGAQLTYNLTSPAVGDKYAYSGWIYAPLSMEGKTVRINFSMRGGANPHNYVSRDLTLRGGMRHYFELTHAVDYADRTQINIQVAYIGDTAGDYVYLDGVQLERKPYATSWHLGGASRAPESLGIPAQGVHRPDQGTVEFWFTPGRTPQTWGRLFNRGSWSSPRTTDQLSIYYGLGWGLNKIGAEVANGTTGQSAAAWLTLPTALVPGRWYYLAFRWALPGHVKLWLYDSEAGQVYQRTAVTDMAPPSFAAYPNLYLGSSGPTVEQANAWFDDLRLSARARSDAEIEAAYQSGVPLPWDAWTTLKADFDGSLRVRWAAFTILPGASASPPGGLYNAPQTVTLTASEPAAIYYTTDGTEPTPASPRYTVPLAVYADTVLRFIAVSDVTGLASPVYTERYAIDQVPPTWPAGSGLSTSDVSTGAFTLHWTPAEDERGVTAYAVYRDGILLTTVAGDVYTHRVTGLVEGAAYEFRVEARDAAGNWSADGPAAVLSTARVPPAVSGRIPGDGDVISARRPTIGATVTDDGAGVDWSTLVLALDDQPVTPSYDPATGQVSYLPQADLAPGAHTVTLAVYDLAGNSTEETWSFTVDPEAPVIAGLTPGGGQRVNTPRPAVGAVVSDETGVDWTSLVLHLDETIVEAVYDAVYGTVSYIPTADLAEGAHSVSLTVYDLAGNPARATWSFVVDVTPPVLTLQLTPPPAGAATWGMTVQADEPLSGPPTVTVTGPDGRVLTLDLTYAGGNTWTGTYTVTRSGAHTVTARAADRAGNAATANASFSQTLGGPLAIVALMPAPGSTVFTPTPLVGFGVDTENGVDEVRAILDGREITLTYDAIADFFYHVPAVPLVPGGHTVVARVYDAYGNLAEITWNFTVALPPSSGSSGSSGSAPPGRLIPVGPRPKPRPLPSPPQFQDLALTWGRAEIEELAAYGVVMGTGEGLFQPGAPLMRGHLFLALGRMIKRLEEAGWLRDSVDFILVVEEPQPEIERWELARILVELGDRLKLSSWPESPPVPPAFSDLEGLGEEEQEAIEEAARRGLMIGRPGGVFDPRAPVTRREGAVALARFWRAVLAQ